MSPLPLEFPDVKEYRVERMMSQLSSVLPTLTNLQAKCASGSSLNRDVSLLGLAQVPKEENEDLEITEMRALQLSAQAGALEENFERLGSVEDIDEAIECRSQVLSLTSNGNAKKLSRSGALGSSFLRRFMRIGNLSDLNKAIEHLTQAALLTPDGNTHNTRWLSNLGITYQVRFERFGELADLKKAIEYFTQALLLIPDDHPERLGRLSNLGAAHYSQFERLGELVDLSKAIAYFTHAVLLTPDEHPSKPGRLHNLGASYQSRFRRLGELADLNKALKSFTQGVLLAPDGNLHKRSLLGGLGCSYQSQFEQHGDLADVIKAIEYKTQAVLLTPDGHPDKRCWLDTLGNSYQSRFEQLGELSDLNKAIECQNQAVLLTPDGHPDKAGRLDNLGISYQSRFERLDELVDLNKAIKYETQAGLLTPDGHPDKLNQLNNLGVSHQSRFKRLGELSDLNKAIECQTRAVLIAPARHPRKCNLLNNLGISYMSRFGRLGELADLNKAIDYFTQAGLLSPDGHLHKPSWLNSLGISYRSRFERLGELADLNKAIEYGTQAFLLTPDGHPDKPCELNNLGASYSSRFGRLGELADLNKAIEYFTQARLLTPDGHPRKPGQLNDLGNSYSTRFQRLGELSDLNQAIEYQTQSVLLTPDRHPDKPNRLSNLGVSYHSLFQRHGELADLNKAIEYETKALALTPDGHADKPKWIRNLGVYYLSRFGHVGDHSDLESAHSFFQNGAQLPLTRPKTQSWCARGWAKCSCVLGLSPLPAYNRCMEIIPHLIWLGTTISQRYTHLSEINDLATEAASWAISIEAFDLALEWLEQGRSIVWNQILQLRNPFDDLFSVDPALAQDLKDTASKLEAAGSRRSALALDNTSDLEKDAQQHHHMASHWERLLEQARTTPGFERFLRPRKAKELMLSATDGPVVVLNAYSTRCDALIIFPGCDDILHLPLPHSLAKLGEVHVQLQSLTGDRGDRKGGFKRSKPIPKPEDMFKSILASCWSEIVRPVLDLLACKHDVPLEEMPHVTWCTTGVLSFLPLHAAGLYDDSRPNASDLIVSSYTPTLSALLTTGTPGTGLHSGLLAVGQAHTRGFCPLPNTAPELSAIEAHAKATRFQRLDGSNATLDSVLEAMERHSWVHLACHATQNLDNPAQSAFHLHDGALTLETITKRSFLNKGLAFLAACHTATGDEKLADEAVHLAAGMLMAGYPSVIATMWSIQDEDGPEIAQKVYAELLKDDKMDHRQAARALHKAIAALREKVGYDAFQRWVPFVHIGV